MNNVLTLEKSNYKVIDDNELVEISGGFVITGTMVAAGVGIVAGGVAVGYAAGTVIESWIS